MKILGQEECLGKSDKQSGRGQDATRHPPRANGYILVLILYNDGNSAYASRCDLPQRSICDSGVT
jgi:hypothetical protein